MTRFSPPTTCSRRSFISGCAACAGCLAGGGLLATKSAPAAAISGAKPGIRLVFCETKNDKPIWPNVGYDFTARRNQILAILAKNCPELRFLPTTIMGQADEARKALADDREVDGYVICVQGLGWGNDIVALCGTGKPTLLVDNLFGGSGLFLGRQPRIMKSGKPVDWVSSSNDEDLAASVNCFKLLKQGKSGAEVAAAFRATRRERTPKTTDWACKPDPIPAPNFEQALAKLRQTKILVVGGGWGGPAFAKAAADVVGVQFLPIKFEQMAAAYAEADLKAAKTWAERWTSAAQEVVEPKPDEIERSAAMYLAMKKLMDQQGATGISVNCLGGFYGGHLKAYPCLGFSQLNNDCLVGGCEADQMSALTMATIGTLLGRQGFISDPVIDTSKNQIIYAHCVAMTKAFGPNGPSNPFRIRSHSEDRHGAAVQSLLPAGYMTTTLEIEPVGRQVIMHQALSAGNNPSDMACRTKLEAVVKGDLEKLTETWRLGWHRVTFYGDLKPCVTELCERLKLKLVEEA